MGGCWVIRYRRPKGGGSLRTWDVPWSHWRNPWLLTTGTGRPEKPEERVGWFEHWHHVERPLDFTRAEAGRPFRCRWRQHIGPGLQFPAKIWARPMTISRHKCLGQTKLLPWFVVYWTSRDLRGICRAKLHIGIGCANDLVKPKSESTCRVKLLVIRMRAEC